MKHLLAFLPLVLFLSAGCASEYRPAEVQAQAIEPTTEYRSPAPQATSTPIPSATIGYQETAIIAQQTADEARRVNVMVTAEFEQRLFNQIQLTAEHERRVQEIYAWTAAAAGTSVPLTATQQVIANTQIAFQRTQESARLTATEHAPTQIMAIVDAQMAEKFGRLNAIARIFAMFGVGIFAIGILVYAFMNPVQPKSPEPEPAAETVITLRRDNGPGGLSLQRLVIPCTPEQFTELAEKTTSGEKTLAINQWEGADTSFTRDTYLPVRSWLQINKLALSDGNGHLIPTDDGMAFFQSWLETRRLPDQFAFEEQTE